MAPSAQSKAQHSSVPAGKPARYRSLDEWEVDLRSQIAQVELIGELDLTEDIAAELGRLIRSLIDRYGDSHATHWLEKYYPSCLAVYLVAHGISGYSHGGFWSKVRETTRLKTDNYGWRWGQIFEEFLRRRQLPMFPEASEQSRRYVSVILLHGGIPDYCLPDFFRDVIAPTLVDPARQEMPAETIVQEWLYDISAQLFTDRPVFYFLNYGGAIAIDFVERSLRMAHVYARKEPLSAADLGLPQRVIDAYEHWSQTSAIDVTSDTLRLQRPMLRLDPWGDGLLATLPEQAIPRGDQAPNLVWTIAASSSELLKRGAFAWNRGAYWHGEPQRVIIAKPASEYAIQFSDDGAISRTWYFTGFTNELPLMAFDAESMQLLRLRGVLPAREVWLLFRGDQQLVAEGRTYLETGGYLFDAWADYQTQLWDLRGLTEIRVGSVTIPVETDVDALRPRLDGARLMLHPKEQASDLFVGRPPDIIIPVPEQADPLIELRRWHLSVGKAEGTMSRVVACDELDDAVICEPGCIRIVLSSPRLLGNETFGTYRISLRGPLGRGRDALFQIALVPSFTVQGHDAIRIPDEQGQLPSCRIAIETAKAIRIQAQESDVRVERQRPGMYIVHIPARHTEVQLQLYENTAISPGVSLDIALPALKWMVSSRNTQASSPVTQAIVKSQTWLNEADDARLSVMIEPGVSTFDAIDVMLEADAGRWHRPQTLGAVYTREIGRWVFDLKALTDTMRASSGSSVCVRLRAVGLPNAKDEFRRDVLYLTRSVAIQDLTVHYLADDEDWLLSFQWRGASDIPHRALRLWSLWRPWDSPLHWSIPATDTESYQVIVPRTNLPPGRYLAEMRVTDSWVEDRPSRPEPGAPGVTEVQIGDAAHIDAYFDHLTITPEALAESVIARTPDHKHGIKALDQFLKDFDSARTGLLLDMLLHNADSVGSKLSLSVDSPFASRMLPLLLKEYPVVIREIIQRVPSLSRSATHRLIRLLIAAGFADTIAVHTNEHLIAERREARKAACDVLRKAYTIGDASEEKLSKWLNDAHLSAELQCYAEHLAQAVIRWQTILHEIIGQDIAGRLESGDKAVLHILLYELYHHPRVLTLEEACDAIHAIATEMPRHISPNVCGILEHCVRRYERNARQPAVRFSGLPLPNAPAKNPASGLTRHDLDQLWQFWPALGLIVDLAAPNEYQSLVWRRVQEYLEQFSRSMPSLGSDATTADLAYAFDRVAICDSFQLLADRGVVPYEVARQIELWSARQDPRATALTYSVGATATVLRCLAHRPSARSLIHADSIKWRERAIKAFDIAPELFTRCLCLAELALAPHQ